MLTSNSKPGRKTLNFHEQIIAMLIEGMSYREVAARLLKDEKQIRREVAKPEFLTLFNRAKADLLREVKDVSFGAARDAMRLLADTVRDARLSKRERESAARYILEMNARFAELLETSEDEFVPVPGAEDREDEQ